MTSNHPTQTSDNKKKPDTKERGPQYRGPKHWRLATLSLTCLLVFVPTGLSIKVSPHQPLNVTWIIYDMIMSTVANSTSKLASPTAWFPDLLVVLCDLVTTDWDPAYRWPPWPLWPSNTGYGCKTPEN